MNADKPLAARLALKADLATEGKAHLKSETVVIRWDPWPRAQSVVRRRGSARRRRYLGYGHGMDDHATTPESLPPLELRELRNLDLSEPPGEGKAAHVASASGVVRRGDFVYVIGDDMLQLAVFEIAANEPGRLVPALPAFAGNAKQHAEHKPDLEALTALPPVDGEPHGGLLGLGSGSGQERDRGFFCPFAADGSLGGEPRVIDFHPVYELLRSELDGEINIEGAAVFEERLWLFHRANRADGPNAVAEFELTDLSRTLADDQVVDRGELRSLRAYDLGEIDGVRVCFSDATTLTGELICFTASAEGSDDGSIRGSVVGTIDAAGEVHRLRTIDSRWKVEGLDATLDTGVISLLFVCDQDDPEVPSPLLSATMPVNARFDG